MKFFIKDFFSNFDQIRSFLRIWSDLPNKSLMETFIFLVLWLNVWNISHHIKHLNKYKHKIYKKNIQFALKRLNVWNIFELIHPDHLHVICQFP